MLDAYIFFCILGVSFGRRPEAQSSASNGSSATATAATGGLQRRELHTDSIGSSERRIHQWKISEIRGFLRTLS